MSTYLPYEANVSRVDDLVRTTRLRQVATPVRSNAGEPVAIRRATAADRESLDRVAALDSAGKVVGEALIAQVDGEPRTAIELMTGRVVTTRYVRRCTWSSSSSSGLTSWRSRPFRAGACASAPASRPPRRGPNGRRRAPAGPGRA